jgi:hypothetical protein
MCSGLYLDVDGVEGHRRLGVQHHKASDDVSSIVKRFVDMNVNLRLAAGLAHLATAVFGSPYQSTARDMKQVITVCVKMPGSRTA